MTTFSHHVDSPQVDANSPPAPWCVWLMVTLVLGILFLAKEQNFLVDVGLLDDYAPSAEAASQQVQGGNAMRRLTFVVLGVLGLVLCGVRSTQPMRHHRLLLGVAVAYGAWVAVTLAWSVEPSLSIKRLIVLYCSVLGTVGVCRHFGLRDLLLTTWVIAFLFVASSVMIELLIRRDSPFAASYRFAGGVHPNSQSAYCAILAITSFFLALESRRFKWPLLSLAVMALVLLVMTKSRTTLVGCLVAMAIPLGALLPPRRSLLLLTAGAWLAAVACAAGALLLVDDNAFGSAVSLGRDQSMANLNGRVPLWSLLLSQYLDGLAWLTGNGYEALWSPRNVERISAQLDWSIPNGHSVYVDTLLSSGVIGLALFTTLLAMGLLRVVRVSLAHPHPQLAAVAAMGLLAFANSFLESSFMTPASFCSFVTACAVLLVAGLGRGPQPSRSTGSGAGRRHFVARAESFASG